MATVQRINLIPNPSFEYGLDSWSAFGGASISQVPSGFLTERMRITYPTATAATAGAQVTITIDPANVGLTHRLWAACPANSGATTTQLSILGISAGAAFSTNDQLFKQGTYDFTPTGTSHTVRIRNASASTAGDYVEVEFSICELYQSAIGNHAYFDGDYPGAYWFGAVGNSISTFPYWDTDVEFSPALPMIITEIDARPIGAGDFVLDRDALDGTAALVSSPRWLVVPEVEQVAIRRGRQSDDQQMQPGICTLTFGDYTGTYDPDNPATPLQTNGVSVMRSGLAVRVTCLAYDGLGALAIRPLFTGRLDDDEVDRTYEPTTTLTAVDDLTKLYTSAIPPFDAPMGTGQTSIWRAAWALGFAGFTFFGVDYGTQMQRHMLGTTGGGNVGSTIEQVVNCEGGKLFAQANGRIKVGTHSDDFVTAPDAVFTDRPSANTDLEYESIVTSSSLKELINRCVVDRGDQADNVTAQDDDSVALNGVKSETVNAPLLDDSEAFALAQWRATRRSTPTTRIKSMSSQLAGQTKWWPVAAGLDIASVIRATRYTQGRGIDGVYSVEGIDHTIDRNVGWQMTVYTSPLDITFLWTGQGQPFTLDTSALDGPDILAAFT